MATEKVINLLLVCSVTTAIAVTGLFVRDRIIGGRSSRQSSPSGRPVESWRQFAVRGFEIGPSTAAATLVTFVDFQCPTCRQFHLVLDSIRERYPRDVRIIFRHSPSGTHHPYALSAAVASECARRQGQFLQFARALYRSQDLIPRKRWASFAIEAGVGDTAAFRSCHEAQLTWPEVREDMAAATALEASVVPSFLLNGAFYDGPRPLETLDRMVRAAINFSQPRVARISYANPQAMRLAIAQSYASAEQWLINNFQDDGSFLYHYDAGLDSVLPANNPIRQLAAGRLLSELSRDRPEMRRLHRRNLDHVMANWFRTTRDGLGYIFYDGNSKLGANAMALRLLVASPFYTEYEHMADALARGILSLATAEGALGAWFIRPTVQEYSDDYYLTFYSGEAILSLLEYGTRSRQTRFVAAATSIADYYIGRYVDQLEKNYYPAYVPWHTMALNHLFKKTRDPRYAAAVFRMTDELLKIQDRDVVIGRFHSAAHPEYGNPHSASDGVYTEGLAYAYEVAALTADSATARRYWHALDLAVGNLISLQFTDEDVASLGIPARAAGAFRTREGSLRMRIDNTQHTMDAYLKILELLEPGPAVPRDYKRELK